MRTRLGTEGGAERVILCTAPWSFYLAVRVAGRYYRLAVGPQFKGGFHMGRS